MGRAVRVCVRNVLQGFFHATPVFLFPLPLFFFLTQSAELVRPKRLWNGGWGRRSWQPIAGAVNQMQVFCL